MRRRSWPRWVRETAQRSLGPVRRQGAVTAARKAVADPATAATYLLSDRTPILPKRRVERPPRPNELAAFVADLGIDTTRGETVGYWLELCDDAAFQDDVTAAFRSTAAGPEMYYHSWRDVLYVLVRHLKPDLVVETGVRGGFSSAHLLRALERNDRGRLVSIDVGDRSLLPDDLADPEVGWIVPRPLRRRWDLRIARSETVLPDVLGRETDLFFSDVPNDVLETELTVAAERLRPDAVVVSSYPDGSEAGTIWRQFAARTLTATATATRWERDGDRSTLCAGLVGDWGGDGDGA